MRSTEMRRGPAHAARSGPARRMVARRDDGRFRPEIQVLRAFAVVAVVLYHFWPGRLRGGFVGVDVFFVISGFLITAHLLREVAATGRISLARFWARRARRLLPAALVVLVVTAVATLLWVPRAYWQQTLREIVGATLYVENWVLAGDSVDYLAASNIASPVQHFWSLSVEEQFYLAWPILLLGIGLLFARGRRVRGRNRDRRIAVAALAVLGFVAAASLVCSSTLTASDPGPAYFATTTRAWEFAAGGLVAVIAGLRDAVGVSGRSPQFLRPLVSWLGWAGLAASLVLIDAATPFPGIAAALPVASTGLVIAAGTPDVSWAPHRLLARRPVLVLGDLSYSVYLWHWPVLVVLGFQLGDAFTWPVKVAVLAVVLGIAGLSHRFIENPVRSAPALARARPRRTFLALVTAVAVVAIPVAVGGAALQRQADAAVQQAQAAASSGAPCFGAAALAPGASCSPPTRALVPDPAAAADDLPAAYADGCVPSLGDPEVTSCTFGTGPVRVAMIGDSHVTSLEPAMRILAAERGWTVTTYYHTACPQSTAKPQGGGPAFQAACERWNASLAGDLAAAKPFDAVLVTHSQERTTYASPQAEEAGYRAAWQPMLDRGSRLVVVRDVPRVAADSAVCLGAAGGPSGAPPAGACAVPRASALPTPDPMVAAATGLPRTTVVDLTSSLCSSSSCAPAIGGVTAYRDTDHLTATYAKTLAPALGAALRKVPTLG